MTFDLTPVHIQNISYYEGEYQAIHIYFACSNWEGSICVGEPDKCDDFMWVSVDQLPENTIDYVRDAIKKAMNNEIYSERWWE